MNKNWGKSIFKRINTGNSEEHYIHLLIGHSSRPDPDHGHQPGWWIKSRTNKSIYPATKPNKKASPDHIWYLVFVGKQ